MVRFEKILVPIDFSEPSRGALILAGDIARQYGATLTLLYVYQPPQSYFPEGYMALSAAAVEDMVRYFEQSLEDAKREAAAQAGVPVASKMVVGIPHVEIEQEASEGGYDLIVMGSHGRTGLGHALLGSVAERVVRKAPCPVLVARAVQVKSAKK